MMKKSDRYAYMIIAAVLILAIILVYGVHYSFRHYRTFDDTCESCAKTPIKYPYPIHGDEWSQLSRAVHMMDNKGLEPINPYTGSKYTNFEPGFTALLAEFFTMTGLDPVYTYQYLSSISIIIILLSLILFCYALTGSYWTGILSAISVLAIKNTTNVLGIWFFLPLTFSLCILFMYMYALISKRTYLIAVFFFLSIIVYPPLTVILALISVPFVLKIIRNKDKRIILGMCGILAAAVISMLIYLKFDPHQIIKTVILPINLNIDKTGGLFSHITALGLIFGIIGIFFLFKEHLEKNLLAPILLFIAIILTRSLLGFGVLVPYLRIYWYAIISLSVLAGLGMFYLSRHAHGFIDKMIDRYAAARPEGMKVRMRSRRIISFTLFFFAGIFMLIGLYHDYYRTQDAAFWPQLTISEKDINALRWINSYADSGSKIIVPQQLAFAYYPISPRTTIAVQVSNLEEGNYGMIEEFYGSGNCTRQEEIIGQTGIDIIYSYFPMPCNFKTLYRKNEIYVYEPNARI